MKNMIWTKELSVGSAILDNQHKIFVAYINLLTEAIQKKESKRALEGILAGLVDYANTHFRDEEIAIASHLDPEQLHHHQNSHDLFLISIFDLQDSYHEGKANIDQEVITFLNYWLSKHIIESDQQDLN